MSMYRDYENPWLLEDQLRDLRREKELFVHTDDNWEEYVDLSVKIHELEERINFAWQDHEETYG